MSAHHPLEIDLAKLPTTAIVYDIVYVPLETALLKQAKHRGMQTVDGLGMLLHQAVAGFEKWFGVCPRVTPKLHAVIAENLQSSVKVK